MSGNVWEWVNSLYLPYPYVADDGREADTGANSPRGLRGSSWFGDVHNLLRVALRSWSDTAIITAYWGFRCARSVD